MDEDTQQNDPQVPNIQEAEIVINGTDSPQNGSIPAPTAFDINAYNATLDVIRRRLVIITKTQEDLKKLKEMYDTVLQNEPTYNQVEEVVKEAQQKKKGIVDQINRLPNVAEMTGKIRDLKDQLKGHDESLATELMDYYRTAGVTEIEDDQGNVQEFKISIKLKPKRKME